MVTAVLCHCGGACKSPKAASTFVDVKIFPLLHLPFPFGSVYFKIFTLMASAAEKRAARPKKNFANFVDTERDSKAKSSTSRKDAERAKRANRAKIT